MRLPTVHYRILQVAFVSVLPHCIGCSVQTVHPLSEAGEIVRDDGLVGEWEERSSTFEDWTPRFAICRESDGCYRLTELEVDRPLRLKGRIVALGQHKYIEAVDVDTFSQGNNPLQSTVETYFFARIERDGNRLTVWYPKLDAVKKAVSDGELNGIIEYQRVVLTSSADEILAFLDANSASVFPEPVICRRAARRIE